MKLKHIRVLLSTVLLSGFIGVSQVQANPFASFGDALSKMRGGSEQQRAPQNASKSGEVQHRKIKYAGYSEEFQSVKALLTDGNAEGAYQSQQKKLEESKSEPALLFSLEQALIALDANKLAEANKHLWQSEQILKQRHNQSMTEDFFKGGMTEIVKATGFSEFGKYDGEAFERILMLNFKSISYMLDGDRKAYNVTRRAIDWQNIEKKAFDKKMKEVGEKLEKKEEEQSGKGNNLGSLNLFDIIKEQYKNSESKALQVPSAFVNPFGFYMAGIVQEFDSYGKYDASLRDNARISYEKALELNPDSVVIKQSIEDVKKQPPKGKRLVQIVVADGFAPEKKVLRFDYAISDTIVPIKLTIYEPDETLVNRIEVQNSSGKKLATLSNIADIDAITMRHQYDSLPEQHLRLTVSIIRSVFEGQLFKQMGAIGGLLKKVRDDSTDPDTRSWMSLPKKILAARLYLPKTSNKLRLVSYDKEGKILASKELLLDKHNHNFVYARSLDKMMYLNQSPKMWVTLK